MFVRLIRTATALSTGICLVCASADTLGGAENVPASAGTAVIELRKSFKPPDRAVRQAVSPELRSGDESDPGAPGETHVIPSQQLGAVAEALGEHLQSSGTLHFPGIGGAGIVLQGSATPILETSAGRHLIIDRDRTLDSNVVEAITSRWPAFSVVQPPAGAHLRDVIGSLLDAAGYDSVLRSAPLVFGRGVTVRVSPDFVVLRSGRDLLSGETHAISVVDRADALPAELRELLGGHRVHIVELTPDGASVGADQAPWRDPAGHVTTMEATRLATIVAEIAGALGCSVERRAQLPSAIGEPDLRADLRIGRGGDWALVFEKYAPRSPEHLVGGGGATLLLDSAANLPLAIGALLRRFGIAAIGPTVEFYRSQGAGSTRRFVISVTGWLAEADGRRLLITGNTLPPLVRLYLTREGIDIFEYRIR